MKKVAHVKTLTKLYLVSRHILFCSKKMKEQEAIRNTLMLLINEKPRTVRELADMYCVQHSFMSNALSSLWKKGLFKKSISKDKRYRLVSITAKGSKILQNAKKEEGRRHCEGFFKNMTDKEVERLDKLLSKFNFEYKPGVK